MIILKRCTEIVRKLAWKLKIFDRIFKIINESEQIGMFMYAMALKAGALANAEIIL